MSIGTEIAVVLALTLANGLFAGAEIAVLSVRKTRLADLASEGKRGAQRVLRLRAAPERFLATVQIGITVVSATTAAFSGATLSVPLAKVLTAAGVQASTAEQIALAAVIAVVSYLSLVLGELVPKSLALRAGERYAMLAARPLLGLSWIARPLVWFLTASSNVVLRLFGDRTSFSEARLSAEELHQIIEEAGEAHTIDREIADIATRALDFGSLRIVSVMRPRAQLTSVAVTTSGDEQIVCLLREGHERIPLHDEAEEITGYVTRRQLARLLGEGKPLSAIARPPYFVPESASAVEVLREMQKQHTHLAMVVDEHGAVSGFVSTEHLVEEVVGDILAEHERPAEEIRAQEDGTFLVEGSTPIHEVNRELGLSLPIGNDCTTIAGLVIATAGRIPNRGSIIPLEHFAEAEVVEAQPHRVELIRLRLRTKEPGNPSGDGP